MNKSNVYVHFVREDYSIMDDGFQGIVTNPDIEIQNNEKFKEEVAKLVTECNKSGDDLRIFSIVFDNGRKKWQVIPDGNSRKYRDAQEVIKTVNRILERAKSSIKPEYKAIRVYLDTYEIDLSHLA